MILIMKDIHLKSLFEEYFQHYGILAVGSMYFRPYNAAEDEIISNYSKYDWHQIFANMTETELRDICTCANVVVLLWCDRATNTPHGMLYLEENFQKREEVFFHGGTWNHEAKFFKEIFRSIIAIFDFLLKNKATLCTTCGIANSRAYKFQESLCFDELKRDKSTIYKILNRQKYEVSSFIRRMRSTNCLIVNQTKNG